MVQNLRDWQTIPMKLDPLVKPRSVAIVGATDRGGPGRAVIESLGAIGFTGPIYPVNPKYPTVMNITCYPSLTELPEAPDIVVFSIRNPLIPEQMRLAVKRGARAAVIYDSGFAELGGDGAKLQDEIAAMAREAGMPVCGPNCMGILNPTVRVTASLPADTERLTPKRRRSDNRAMQTDPLCDTMPTLPTIAAGSRTFCL